MKLTEPEDFLYSVYMDHARNNKANQTTISQNPLLIAAFDVLINKCSFGYCVVYLDISAPSKLQLTYKEEYACY